MDLPKLSRHFSAEIIITLMIALLSLVLSAYSGYTNNDKAIEHRLTAAEIQQQNDQPRLERMENKLDKLVNWALGSSK